MATNDKLAAAAHLVIARLRADQLGATKLNKVLWFADCAHYRRHGRSLTGEREYVRKDNGPCPQRMEAVIHTLKERGKIAETLQPVIHYSRREFTALQEPDLSGFTVEEIDLLLSVALELAPLSAQGVSELSHDALWEEATPGGRIPVAAGAVSARPLLEADIPWARKAFA